jgi:hypothetical protein
MVNWIILKGNLVALTAKMFSSSELHEEHVVAQNIEGSKCNIRNVIFQHPAALYTRISDLGDSAPSKCNVVRCSFIVSYLPTSNGPTCHLQV